MAYLGKTFNTADLPVQEEFKPLPAGDYQVNIEDMVLKTTNNQQGEYLETKLRVMGPTHQNRTIYDRIIIGHANPQAEEIGLKRFNALIRAAGLASANDTDQFISKIVTCTLKIGKPKEQYPNPGNDVVTYKAAEQSAAPMPGQAPAAPAAPAKKPWER